MKASVVIGANWGDEGKGLMTDYLCRKHNADMVVRFNGGAQAGHTVVTPEGQRHVFSHIGSGYFAGVPTYLSEHFVLNPMIFKKEFEELKIPNDYKIYVHPNCQITTVWDMIANQAKEEMRGNARHGSCGFGIGETIERVENCNIDFTASYRSYDELRDICNYWEHNLSKELPWVKDAFNVKHEFDKKYLEDIIFMFKHVIIDIPKFEYAIFEGAQGLALDQFMGNFPYVTRSNTGMRNVIDIQRKMRFDLDEIVYVSRTYETRHGNDPYFRGSYEPLKGCHDKTNNPNDWQGTLMYKELDYYDLAKRIYIDVGSNNLDKEKVRVAFTHNDQIKVNDRDFYDCLLLVADYKYLASGETYKDVEEV